MDRYQVAPDLKIAYSPTKQKFELESTAFGVKLVHELDQAAAYRLGVFLETHGVCSSPRQ